ncbi:sensor histidine kinase [Cellulomonas triticagri]|uniref:Histidine kinase n=1 Tax=Cellulomonas triticagri TaxID=2483352 RepID=A0A3M2JRE5_9CELL|nr:histidine kinase [Cellulomonas triticagri]RMI14440.1 histidine kinase [Cellulomonas triticagri]
MTRTRISLAGWVRATWWYTVAGVVVLDVMVVGYWWLWLAGLPPEHVLPAAPVLAGLGAVLQVGAVVLLVRDYPASADHDDTRDGRHRRRTLGVLVAGAVGSALLGVTTGSWMLGVGLLAVLVGLLRWPPGIRWRLTVVLTLLLVALWVVDAPRLGTDAPEGPDLSRVAATLLLTLPTLCAFSLWWWDVVRELDRARATAGALSATRERLRLAGEVHDLQGHHLQVVALQLELAERLIEHDPAAAAEQIRTARASVDEARAGTRDLATRFRGVPLPDELANAADLLRAAGHDVRVDLGPDAAQAPADVLGPLVRESVTNVLKHGAGARARISLRREADRWVYAITNDRRPGPAPDADGTDGTGLAAIRERIAALGGTVQVRADADFALTVAVPAGGAA